MSGRKLPAVRLQSLPAVPTEDADGLNTEAVVVELPPSNKFGFAWPESSATPALPDQPLSHLSSDAETDSSEAESFTPANDVVEDSNHDTPTNNMDLDINPLEDVAPAAPSPRLPLSRVFSLPNPSQLRHLRNPRRLAPSPDGEWNTSPVELSPEYAHFHELSLELADSVQAAIQMLLQLSPPQLLDHAKEQLSGCSLSIPTTSISAMFTCMKNLNYMSANMSAFSTAPPDFNAASLHPSSLPKPVSQETHFDIGEILQCVGDSLSGLAAQAGVDLVLFHQDVGMKHVAVKGNESGLSYTISYIVRQIIGTAWRGDSVELGLFIESTPSDATGSSGSPSSSMDADPAPTSRLRCTFYIAHRFSASEPSYRPSSKPPSPTIISSIPSPDPSATSSRPLPSFKTIIMRRLLRQIDADFTTNVPTDAFSEGRAGELVVNLDQGSIPEHSSTSDSCTFSNIPIASEPSLQELVQFLESLRGKKVTLCATSRGSFAHHLSSYLTAWGLDVSHVSIDPQNEGGAACEGTPVPEYFTFPSGTTNPPTPAGTVPSESSTSPSFLLIDDNVDVLKYRLEKLRLESATQMPLPSKRRPALSYRPKSTSHIPRGTGSSSFSLNPSSYNTVIIHFTSLSNYKRVKDTIQQVLSVTNAFSPRIPEVIVIPKPAGPRRVLTALFTATNKPVVDPLFSPIATSPMTPMTPNIQILSPFFTPDDGFKLRHMSRPSGSQRSNSDRSSKSPKDITTETSPHPSSPLAVSDSMEYFSEAAVKLGSSPSSGLVIQSPDGQPAGIFFLPGAKGTGTGLGLGIGPGTGSAARSTVPSPTMERDRAQFGMAPRRMSDEAKCAQPALAYFPVVDSMRRSPRPPISTDISEPSGSTDKPTGADSPTDVTSQQDSVRSVQRKQTQASEGTTQKVSSPPSSPGGRGSVINASRRGNGGRRVGADTKPLTPPVGSKKQKGAQDGNIVPPISVLIVDDNPINQTILSTFMKKKRIKYDVAKNGEEAVQKWKSGVFHLILMDIQMPVMDGIQATKEIRRMEKLNGAVGFPSTPVYDGPSTPSDVASNDSRSASTPYRSSVIIVALTASSLQSDRVAALAAGCNDFLTKPVSLHWLNSKIIEWGSIKALQMWADIRPEVVKNFSNGQVAQAQKVARRLHVPEGRSTPSGTPTRSRSRSSSLSKQASNTSKWVLTSMPASSISPSPETEVPSPETSLPVVLPVMVAQNPANGRHADIVSLDKEFLPAPDETPGVSGEVEDVNKRDEEALPADAEEQ